ncbi:iron-siderophore ABC transporter substrate-binding protein [Kitasatospora sp. YST-16]|uniref:ABC transporter substrate-binding protein n=1 Tax=unclassified Kitasatospora TaxID=2633591 RepID=UPI0004C2F1C5|nr:MULTISPECIES: iron-siderophore ABC transporter substrate-binding protein [unclassified Kitasatospora]WAL70214.1 iron-siderophore ABC transporter substrate-binding protein [Kitasatospora sp. YST-16]WNW36255.1 iron-siderophore ABC transporter substrate-binding protein [Streptomyces sp. Li-HN-5-13]
MTNRKLSAAVLAAVLSTALLTACGSEGTSDAKPAASQAAGDSAAAFPRSVKHALGTAEIKAQPKRVVVLDSGELDDVTLLGITPVGAVAPHLKTEGGFPAYLKGKVDGTKDVGPMNEPNLELIASLKPDLILTSKVRHEKVYDKLNAIAPTVMAETTGEPWKANLKLYAQALGKETEAAKALGDYEARAAKLGEEIKAKYNGTAPSVSVVRFVAGPTRLYQNASFSGVVLKDAGLARAIKAPDVDKAMLDVSPEQINQADADLVFVTTSDDPSKTKQAEVQQTAVWQGLNAVKNGKVFTVPDETWMSGIGVQAADRMLGDIASAAGVDAPK